jgi:hypothetical protein
MIAYYYKSYSDGESQYFNLNLDDNGEIKFPLIGVHFDLNFTEQDIINKTDEIFQSLDIGTVENIIIDYGDSSFNRIR